MAQLHHLIPILCYDQMCQNKVVDQLCTFGLSSQHVAATNQTQVHMCKIWPRHHSTTRHLDKQVHKCSHSASEPPTRKHFYICQLKISNTCKDSHRFCNSIRFTHDSKVAAKDVAVSHSYSDKKNVAFTFRITGLIVAGCCFLGYRPRTSRFT